ncbi:MAG: transcriptional repressor [Muribaculaceae bacterium]|nr:transcriptional repressor [Muribaculaceae bacterium]
MKNVMTMAEVEALLTEHGVRPTANRVTICRALAAARGPVSLMDLETLLETIDRSVIFRTLGVFREHHVVHVIEDGSVSVKYELCHSHNHAETDDTHAHFYCVKCGKTTCLEQLTVPVVALPDGYKAHSTNFLIKGLCPHCSFKDVE